MYRDSLIQRLNEYIKEISGLDKREVQKRVVKEFSLKRSRSVYYCDDFAVRFSYCSSGEFSGCVLALSTLIKFNDRPFLICVTTLTENYLLLANTTFLTKISHTSQNLRVDCIRGTFLGSDIAKEIDGITNEPCNFKKLYSIHESIDFAKDLERLVEATKKIVPRKKKIELTAEDIENIYCAPERAEKFIHSHSFALLKEDLEMRVERVKKQIQEAVYLENVNLRGRVIEYLITSDLEDKTRKVLIDALDHHTTIPRIVTHNQLGDYTKNFDDFITETDIKTKVLFRKANPKAYNLDKALEFLSKEKSVYLLFFVGIDKDNQITTRLCSMFEQQLLNDTRFMNQWAGLDMRGVTQFSGDTTKELLFNQTNHIDIEQAKRRLKEMIEK